MRMFETAVEMAVCACLCAALAGCAAASGAPEESDAAPAAKSAPAPLHPGLEESRDAGKAPLREGKDEITVLVLNACGIEGAAEETAQKVRALGFENVTVDNATLWSRSQNQVSYRHEEHWAEVQELMELFGLNDPRGMYCYDETPSAGGWGQEYDILVMVGDPSVQGDPAYVGGAPI